MKKSEFLSNIKNQSISKDAVFAIQEKYGIQLPPLVEKIISLSKEGIFFDDDWRVLSLSEIMEASEDLHVDFCNLKLIPMIDTGDNDFIVYHILDKKWSKFNVVDEICFMKRDTLEELL